MGMVGIEHPKQRMSPAHSSVYPINKKVSYIIPLYFKENSQKRKIEMMRDFYG